MKTNILKINKNKLLKLKLIKSKVLKKKHFLNDIGIENIQLKLKKTLYLIYLYHLNNKRILFVGNPLKINNELTTIFTKTKHIFIPKSSWIAGIITNQQSSFKSHFKQESQINKISQRLLQLKRKSDLVIIMDQKKESQALKESYVARIPVVSLNSNLNNFDEKSNYNLPVSLVSSKHNINNNLFYSLIFTTLKKAQVVKKKFAFLVHKVKIKSLNLKKKKLLNNVIKKK